MAYPVPLARQRNLILFSLIALAAAAWAFLLWQSRGMGGEGMGLTRGMAAPIFMGMWAAMMVVMMFPTAAPMVLTFAKVHASKRERGLPYVPTWVFVAGYLAVWIAFGLLAYGAALVAESLGERLPWMVENGGRIGGGVLLAAGLYQLSPLKHVCLSKCRSPVAFILGSWRDGYWGSFRMGLEHGVYCLGCCWLLFLILFPLGVMNVAVMGLITALIFAEKTLPLGTQVRFLAAGALMVYGAVAALKPEALPTAL